jgi:hypothetical protein
MRPVLTHSRLRSSGGELDDSIDSIAPVSSIQGKDRPRRSPRAGGIDIFDTDSGSVSTPNAVAEDSTPPLAALRPKPLAEVQSRQPGSSSNRLLEIALRGGSEGSNSGTATSFGEEDVPISEVSSRPKRTSPKLLDRGGKTIFGLDAPSSVDGHSALAVDTAEPPRRVKSMGSRRLPPVSPTSDDVVAFEDGDLESPSSKPRRTSPSLSRTNSWDSDPASSPEAVTKESNARSPRLSGVAAGTSSALQNSKNGNLSLNNSRRIVDSLCEADLRKAFDSCPRNIKGGINIGYVSRCAYKCVFLYG